MSELHLMKRLHGIPLRLSSIKELGADCEALERLGFCPNIIKLDISCNQQYDYCYLVVAIKPLAASTLPTEVETLQLCCCRIPYPEEPDAR